MPAGLGASLPSLSDTTGSSGAGSPPPIDGTLADGFKFNDNHQMLAVKRYNPAVNEAINVHPVQTPQWFIGRTISETVGIQQTITPSLRYGWTINEQLHMHAALQVGIPVGLADGIGIHPVQTVCIAVTILQALGIAASPLPTLRYTQTLVAGIGMHDALRNFFGAQLGDGVGMHETLSKQLRANPVLHEGIGIAEALSNHFVVRVIVDEHIGIDDHTVLKMIYNGQLADGIEVTAAYVSPDGNLTTWAINTRTGAATEYDNYDFNSYAQIGDHYFGARSDGLYKLIGDTDAGADIIAHIKSGFAQWASSRLALIRGVYLGLRGAGDYVLKVITQDGQEYIYGVNAKDAATTKVTVGKGLRARYWAFELINTGQDFDLDTVEFVPLTSERRV